MTGPVGPTRRRPGERPADTERTGRAVRPRASAGGLGARAPLTRAEAAVRRAVWRHLLRSSGPLGAARLARVLRVTPARAAALLGRLEAKDYVVLARPSLTVAAAYPLSAVPTRHRVHIGYGRSVFAP